MALFGLFLILSGIFPGDWSPVFAVLAFVSLIFWIRKSLALWHLDRLVFDRKAVSTPRRLPASVSPRAYRDDSGCRGEIPSHQAV